MINDPQSNHYKTSRGTLANFLCPSDEFASSPYKDDILTWGFNPTEGQGLSYVGSMGPTIPDQCDFIPQPDTSTPPLGPQVCMGSNFGTPSAPNLSAPCRNQKGGALKCVQEGLCVGMICREPEGLKLRKVADGLSKTYMAGETLPGHWNRNCIFCTNFPIASTHIPLNTFLDYHDIGGDAYYQWSGFKSRHPGGANMLMGDGSVQFVIDSIDYLAWNQTGTTAGGEVPTDGL